jgi:hypothetical protein
MNTTAEIDAVRAQNIALQAECTRLRGQLERCRQRAREIINAWIEYDELGKLKERLELAQRPPARTVRNGAVRRDD